MIRNVALWLALALAQPALAQPALAQTAPTAAPNPAPRQIVTDKAFADQAGQARCEET